MNPVLVRARLLRAARNDRPSRESAKRVLASALLVSLETCSTSSPRHRPAVSRDLLRHLLLPLAVLIVAGDPVPSHRAPLVVSARASRGPAAPAVVEAPTPAVVVSSARPSLLAPAPAPPPPAAVPPRGAIPDELSLLRRARGSLPADPAGALAALAAHDRLYPRGHLREEAEAIRVHALFAANDRPATRAAAARFLAAHPQSPYAPRVRTVDARVAAQDE